MSNEPRLKTRYGLSRLTGLPAAVITLGWVSLFTDIASEMAYPVIPLFMTATLAAPALALGFVEGIAEAIVSLMKGVSGWHSDRLRRRVPYVRWGYGLGAGAKLLLAVAGAWPMVLLARGVDRFGKGLRTTARDALIADIVPAEQGGRAFGFHRAMDTAGALVGALAAAGLLAIMPQGYRAIFALALIPGAAAVWLTFRVREPEAPAAESHPDGASTPTEPLSPAYWRACLLMTLFAFANSSDAFLLLRAHDAGLSDVAVILAYAWYNLSYTLLSYPAGVFSDRFGRWGALRLGWLLYAIVYLAFPLTSGPGLWALFLVYGAYMGLTQGVGKALVAEHAPKTRRGTALGLFHMLGGFAMLAGSIAAGALWDTAGSKPAFWLGAGLALAALALSFVLQRPARRP